MQVTNTLEDFDRDVETETNNVVPLSASKPFGRHVHLVISSLNQYQCYQRHKHQQEQEASGIKVKLEEGSSSPSPSSQSSPSSFNTRSSSNIVHGTQDWHDSLKLTCKLGTAILADREPTKATRNSPAVSNSIFLSNVAEKPCFSKIFGSHNHDIADSRCFVSAIIISIFRNNKDLIDTVKEERYDPNRRGYDKVYVDKYQGVSASDTWPVVRAVSFLNKLERSIQRSEQDLAREVAHAFDPWSAIALRLKKWGRATTALTVLQYEEFRSAITTELAEGMMEIYKKLKASALDAHMRNLQDKAKQLLEQRESGKIRERDS